VQDFAVVCSVIDTKYDIIMWEEHEQKSDPLASATREPLFHCSSHIMASYCVSYRELKHVGRQHDGNGNNESMKINK
jgi:hypothetical protein